MCDLTKNFFEAVIKTNLRTYQRKSKYKRNRSSHQRCSVKKKVFLEISQNSQENTCARASFLIKLQAFLQNTYGRLLLKNTRADKVINVV